MRRVILLLTVMAAALAFASGVALAATIVGTNRGETLIGTRYADYIRADGGDDVVRGLGGPDQLYGNLGGDRIVGGNGTDSLFGGYGNDRLNSRDLDQSGIGNRDLVDCGPGRDFVRGDFDDRVRRNCEGGSFAGF